MVNYVCAFSQSELAKYFEISPKSGKMKRSCVLIGYPRRHDGPILSALVILTSPLITDITKTRNGVRGTGSGERGTTKGTGK